MEHKNYRVEIMQPAARKLSGHIAFLAQVSKVAATRLYDEIYTDMLGLEDQPGKFARYISKRFPDRVLHRRPSGKRYWIIYEIQEEKSLVSIVDIQDCRQGEDKHLV